MARANQAPIIIKRIKKAGHGHHGGAWKVAYADFVTAMMAFFLLMWLINTTSPDQRRGIAEFFAPASVSRVSSGAGGMLAGTSFADSGVRNGFSAPVAAGNPEFTSNRTADDGNQQAATQSEAQPTEDSLSRARSIREDAQFARAAEAIRQAMADMPDVGELSRNVIVEQTPEGLKIQIVDQEGRSMFNPGAAEPNERAHRLLSSISRIIAQLPNRLTISGHTDGNSPGRGYAELGTLLGARERRAARPRSRRGAGGPHLSGRGPRRFRAAVSGRPDLAGQPTHRHHLAARSAAAAGKSRPLTGDEP
jgi:chemotaxis protein MotB